MENCIRFVKKTLENAEAGHDWFHIERVYKMAKFIAQSYTCNQDVVSFAALLHDIADAKFHNGDENIGPEKARFFLESENKDPKLIEEVVMIIQRISYKNSFDNHQEKSIELQIVQDADRLDALGAIGIARTFQYGGYKNQLIFDPEIAIENLQSKSDYLSRKTSSVHHFYEKLLLLKDMMNTPCAKKIAEERHQFLVQFLNQFHKEWNAEL